MANPPKRLVLFEGRSAAGRDHMVGLSYTGQPWDNTARGDGAVMHHLVGQVVAGLAALLPVVTDVWWVVCPSRNDIVATKREPDTLRRIHPTEWGLWGCVYYTWHVSRALAGCWEAGRRAVAVPRPSGEQCVLGCVNMGVSTIRHVVHNSGWRTACICLRGSRQAQPSHGYIVVYIPVVHGYANKSPACTCAFCLVHSCEENTSEFELSCKLPSVCHIIENLLTRTYVSSKSRLRHRRRHRQT